jgi:hypothetical protein
MAGLMSSQVTNWQAPWTLSLYWQALIVLVALVCAWVVWSIGAHTVGRISRAVLGAGLGVLSGVLLIIAGVQMAHLAWPNLPQDPLLSLVGIGGLAGAFAAAAVLFDHRAVGSTV